MPDGRLHDSGDCAVRGFPVYQYTLHSCVVIYRQTQSGRRSNIMVRFTRPTTQQTEPRLIWERRLNLRCDPRDYMTRWPALYNNRKSRSWIGGATIFLCICTLKGTQRPMRYVSIQQSASNNVRPIRGLTGQFVYKVPCLQK